MSEEKSTVRDDQKQATRVKILESATKIMLDPDFSSLNTNELAEQAEVSKGTIFHHFGSKDQLMLAVLEHIFEEQVETVFIAEDHPTDPAEQLRAYTKMNFDLMIKNGHMATFLIQILFDLKSEEHHEYLEDFINRLTESTVGQITELFGKLGWNSSKDVLTAARLYLAIIDGLGLQIGMARSLPSNALVDIEIEPTVDLIVSLFDKR